MLKIYRAGNDVSEIETICELKKIDFFDVVYSIQKIRDRKYHGNFKEVLGSVLVKISVLAGIKNEIDSFTKQDISKMITTTYNDLAIEEIYKAFELERYGVYENKTEHFQMFDSNYISAILKKYRKWKLEEKQTLNFSPPAALIPEKTDNEKKEIRLKFIQMLYEDLKKDKFSDSGWLLYYELINSGKIKITDEEKKELYNKQLLAYATEQRAEITKKNAITHKSLFQALNDKIHSGNPIQVVQNKCKSILVSKFLNENMYDYETFKNSILL